MANTKIASYLVHKAIRLWNAVSWIFKANGFSHNNGRAHFEQPVLIISIDYIGSFEKMVKWPEPAYSRNWTNHCTIRKLQIYMKISCLNFLANNVLHTYQFSTLTQSGIFDRIVLIRTLIMTSLMSMQIYSNTKAVRFQD